MFLQFFIWGSWYATAGNYMNHSGLGEVIYIAYMASPIGSIVAPFFLGLVADRFFSVQKVLGTMHILSAVFIIAAPLSLELFDSVPLFLIFLLLHMLCYMPTVGLATATAFHNLTDRESQFPLIRVSGTIGWIVAGIIVSYLLHSDSTAIPMYVAGSAGLLMGVYSFTLPNVPPPAAGKKVSFRDILGIDALSKLNSRPVIVFLISILLTSIPLATYYAYVPVFLNAAGIPDPAFKMSFGQMSEVLFLLFMPWFLLRWGVRRVVIAGMLAWVLRYALFAFGASEAVTWMIIGGILLHGLCYDFVYIAGQIYLDQKAPVAIRAQAQGLFVLVSYGLGQGLGTLIAGWIYNRVVTGHGSVLLHQWHIFWITPLVLGTLITLGFILGSVERKPSENTA